MDWLIDVQQRMKRKNSILFAKDSPFLADLSDLISQIDHHALVLWALELAEEAAAVLLLRYPDETRPMAAVLTSGDWAAGRVKMRARRDGPSLMSMPSPGTSKALKILPCATQSARPAGWSIRQATRWAFRSTS